MTDKGIQIQDHLDILTKEIIDAFAKDVVD